MAKALPMQPKLKKALATTSQLNWAIMRIWIGKTLKRSLRTGNKINNINNINLQWESLMPFKDLQYIVLLVCVVGLYEFLCAAVIIFSQNFFTKFHTILHCISKVFPSLMCPLVSCVLKRSYMRLGNNKIWTYHNS